MEIGAVQESFKLIVDLGVLIFKQELSVASVSKEVLGKIYGNSFP